MKIFYFRAIFGGIKFELKRQYWSGNRQGERRKERMSGFPDDLYGIQPQDLHVKVGNRGIYSGWLEKFSPPPLYNSSLFL